MNMSKARPFLIATLVAAAAVAGYFFWRGEGGDAVPEGFARGNGRVEAVELDVASNIRGGSTPFSCTRGNSLR